jgi:hypothetical protein
MKTPLPFLVFLFGSFCGRGQTDSITNDLLTTKKFRRGIFMDYEAFRKNRPTLDKGFKVVADTGKFDRYYLVSEKGKKIRNVYGFSDGFDLYLNAQVYCDLNYYVKILLLGPLSYFEDKAGKSNALSSHRRAWRVVGFALGGVIGGAVGTLISSGRATGQAGWVIYLDDPDGQAYLFDAKTLLSIFKEKSPALYERLKSEREKGKFEILMQYMEEFNALDQK